MFDGQSTVSVDQLSGQGVVVDLSAVFSNLDALPLEQAALEILDMTDRIDEVIVDTSENLDVAPSGIVLSALEQRLASRFGRGNAWLAGDAAHVAAPMGVQSMNVGLREARALVGSIHAILAGDASPDALETYGRQRRKEWRALLGLEESKVQVILVPNGGAFGGKEDLSVQGHAALAALTGGGG